MSACPHCGKPIAVTLDKGGAVGNTPASRQFKPGESTSEIIEFITALDNASVEVTDFEASFIEGTLERAQKYGADSVRFSDKQLNVIGLLRKKYEDQVKYTPASAPEPGHATPSPKRETPASKPAPEKDDIPF